MEITHRIRIDMLRKGVPPVVDAMQFDAFTRVVEVELFSNGVAWNPPDGTTFAVSYGKPDGKRGFYELLPDGSNAISVSGNVVSATIAPQALTVAGTVFVALVMRSAETDRLSSFPFEIHVTADPSAGTTDSEDYFNPCAAENAVLFTPQTLTPAQQAQARKNLGITNTGSTPIAYLYNGVKLPPLPDWDEEAYPYAYIREPDVLDTGYTFYVSPMPWRYYKEDGSFTDGVGYVDLPDGESIIYYESELSEGQWEDFDDFRMSNNLGITNVIWSNKPIYNKADGTLYMNGSDPVPVYPEGGGGAVDAVLYTEQTLTPEQQEQARKNIGADAVLIDLDTYGETPVSLILSDLFRQGGGVRENVDIGNLMDALLTDNPLRVQFTFGVNVLYAYGVCVGRVNNKAVQLNLNAMFTYQGKTYVAYVSIDTPSADEAGKANISMSVEEPGELQEAPVQSVNGQTGAVQLSAADVGARPDYWMPTAQEVGALPNTYTPPNQTAEQVGADPKGTAASAVSQHNTADDSHNDIRRELKAINDRLTAFFDSDNQTLDELSEIVAYITSNKSLIDAITTSKVSVTDIIDNLATNVANKPLSAAQGVVLKGLIDTLSGNLVNYQPKGDYALRDELPAVPVKSVNGKTGDVSLSAADVKARPDSWMPTASDVGAVSSSQLPAAINAALEQAKTSGEFDGKDYSFDPTVYGLPVLYLTGDTSPIAVSKDNKVTLDYVYGERSGTCTLKGQGATSYKTAQALVNAGKKGKFNYTIKFDTAFEAKEGWGAQEKYCLKANFIDTTHSRNICSCKLWGMSVKARSTVPSQMANLPNGGAIDGFPIIIMLNGEFHGLYTWNIPKDGWMFGMVEDAAKTQAIVGADDHTTATQFKEASMTGFEVEFVSDEDNADWVNTSLTRMISAVMNSNGSDLDTTVAQYLDWDSAIDHYIHTVVDKATDCVDKNYLLVTFDGVKWYMSAYDRDSIHGLNWDASGTTRPVSNVNFVECAETVRVYELIKRFKTNALKARYKELRGNILSESRIMEKFENFAWAIPSPVMQEDVKLYPTIKGSGVNTIDQVGRFVRQRLVRCDEWVDALPEQEVPVEPEKPVEMVNQVPISTDTDGSIYNGTGYKDNARLSSSGGVSGTAQNGSVVTGFIPYTPHQTIRIKGAEWLNATANYQGHYYLNFYGSDKTLLSDAYVSSQTYAGGTFDADISIDYDSATKITTFTWKDPSRTTGFTNRVRDAAFFRINAYGKGADLIVTVNQEITA